MTEKDAERDDELLEALATALTDAGELLPTDEAEVARAEQRGVEEIPLPPELEELRFDDHPDEAEQPSEPAHATEQAPATEGALDLEAYRRRRGLMTHGLALALGAAAAALITLRVAPPETSPDLPVSGDPAGATSSGAGPAKIPLSLTAGACEACCAGSACETAGELTSCSSGRSCIPCDAKSLAGSRYRLRLGAVSPAELGQKTLAVYPQGEPEICLRAGVSKEICVPTRIADEEPSRWDLLPMVVTAEDLAAKLSVRLRWKGASGPQAVAGSWTMPVALTPRSLCNGYVVRLHNEQEDALFGTMSLFFDDTHYVELMRAGDTAPLRQLRQRLAPSGFSLQLHETREPGARHFALTAGPFDLAAAESLRWQLLEQKQTATTTVGSDYLGPPKPLP